MRLCHVVSKADSDQLHVDVVARLDEIVAGWPFGWRQIDHPLDRKPRALDDRRLDCDLEALADERFVDVLEGDPLHVRAEIAGAQELAPGASAAMLSAIEHSVISTTWRGWRFTT